jgi:hypothetical protein
LDIPVAVASQYLAGALLNLLKWWLEADMPYTPPQMDQIFQQLALPGVWATFEGQAEGEIFDWKRAGHLRYWRRKSYLETGRYQHHNGNLTPGTLGIACPGRPDRQSRGPEALMLQRCGRPGPNQPSPALELYTCLWVYLQVTVPVRHRATAEIGSHQAQQPIGPHVRERNRPAFTRPDARRREQKIWKWSQPMADHAASSTIAGDMERSQRVLQPPAPPYPSPGSAYLLTHSKSPPDGM